MAKGTFGTPRAVGSVEEIIIDKVVIRLSNDGVYEINATLLEGNNTGTFEEVETGFLRIRETDLAAPDQAFLDNFLRMVLSEYVDDKGYSGVVIT